MENSSYTNSTDASSVNLTQNAPELKPYAKECFYVAMVLQWINVVLILSLNTAVIITIVRYRKKSRLYFLLINMAIADLATGITDALVNALERSFGAPYITYWFVGGMYFCKIQRWVSSVTLCASNFILAATSVDRAIVVAKPMMNFKRGYILQKILIVICWFASAIISSPFIHINELRTAPSKYFEDSPDIPHCDITVGLEGWKLMFLMMLLFYALIPLVVIVISYSILIFAIYKRARTPPNSVRGFENLNISLVFNRGLPSSKVRSIKLTFGIVLSFLISWSPYFIILYLALYHHFQSPVIMPFITTFYWNCVANPVMFFVFHKRKGPRSPTSFYSNDSPLNKTVSSNGNRSTPTRDGDNSVMIPLTHVNSKLGNRQQAYIGTEKKMGNSIPVTCQSNT